jgi:hypothetical protein
MSRLLGHRPHGLHIRRTGHNPPRGPIAVWWVLKIANAAGTNGLTWLPKRGARDNKFLVTHPMTDQRCLTSAIARRSALTAEPSSSLLFGQVRTKFNFHTHLSLIPDFSSFSYAYPTKWGRYSNVFVWQRRGILVPQHKTEWQPFDDLCLYVYSYMSFCFHQ